MYVHIHNMVAQTNNRFTPDIAILEQSQFQLVFVCDDLMHAGKNYSLLEDCSANVARAFTMRPYNFYRKNTDGTPVVMNPTGLMETGCYKIKGEIHAILSSEMPRLDRHYQNGVQFKRYRTKLLYPTRATGTIRNEGEMGRAYSIIGPKRFLLPERVDILEAWMYIGLRSYWDALLDGGFAFERVRLVEPERIRNWLPKYYHWQNRP
jgi:hypothetical protein